MERRLARGVQVDPAVAVPASREPAEPEPDAVAADDVKPVTEEAAVPATAAVSAEEPSWPDAAAESAFLAEARARGEAPVPVRKADPAEETDASPLPPVEQLVGRVPAGVRELLDDLFRARFTRTARIPRRALKE